MARCEALSRRLTQVSDPTGTYQFTFDNIERLTGTTTNYSFVTGRTFTNSYAYDAASNRTSFTDPENGVTSYVYDTLSRLTTLTPPAAISSGSFGLSYDALSRGTQMTRPNTVNTSYTYDNLSRLLSVLHKLSAVTFDGATYTVDAVGNRVSKTNQLTNLSELYSYDAIYQLTQVVPGELYSYDKVGNRLSSLLVPTYTYNNSNQLTSTSTPTSTSTYTYDNNGNTLTKTEGSNVTTYTWDFENRLVSVALPGSGGTVSFKYDPFGRRIQKSAASGTTNYAYDAANIAEEADATGSVVARYAMGSEVDEPLAMLRGGTTSYYQADGLGSITSLTDSSGVLAASYTYDSFGRLVTTSGTLVNPFRYTGREFDLESGLHFYRARYFDGAIGRFSNEDALRFDGGGTNFYPYVGNNPVLRTDPLGLKPGDSYPSKQEAALFALLDAVLLSNKSGWEYGGVIYKNWDGTYSYTEPRTDQDPFSVDVGECPFWKRFVGKYHAHPYNPLAHSYDPSDWDLNHAKEDNWLGVWNGTIIYFNNRGKQQVVANIRLKFLGLHLGGSK